MITVGQTAAGLPLLLESSHTSILTKQAFNTLYRGFHVTVISFLFFVLKWSADMFSHFGHFYHVAKTSRNTNGLQGAFFSFGRGQGGAQWRDLFRNIDHERLYTIIHVIVKVLPE